MVHFDTTVSMVTTQWSIVTLELSTLSPQWSIRNHNDNDHSDIAMEQCEITVEHCDSTVEPRVNTLEYCVTAV